jgi:hypothetical protein
MQRDPILDGRSSNTTKTVSTGPSFLGWLTLLFIALKLTGYITWSWFWVLSPMIFYVCAIVFIIALLGIIAAYKG